MPINSMILVDDNFDRDLGFDSGIKDEISIARMDSIYGNVVKDLVYTG